jgi:hypothetical protein
MSRLLILLILASSALLTACGGGSDANIPGPSLPVVVAQPADQAVLEGNPATFSVNAAGAGALGYQWQFSTDGVTWTNIAGATGATYSTGAVTASMNGNRYRVVITNALGSTTSSAVRLSVTPTVIAPQVTVPPSNQTVTAPNTATFTVTATGTSPAFQWQLSTDGGTTFAAVSGATSATLTVTNTTTAQSGHRYRVVVSNSAGTVTSTAATLTVNPTPVAPAITTQPASRTITAGSNVDFIVAASGTPAPGYQWRLGAGALTDGALGSGACSGATVAGATTATLTLTNVPIGCSGSTFTVVVSNGVAPDATSSAATLTVNPAPVAPAITTQPAGEVVVTAGAAATFSAAASGVPSPTVQWQVSTDGGASYSNITGATSGSYTTPATVPGDEGRRYRLVATNSQGSANSAAGVLYVYAAPVVTNPVDASVIAGQTATFSVTVTGGQGAAALQWQRAEGATPTTFVDIAGATGASYTTPATVTGDNNARFRVRWSNSSNDPAPAAISNNGTSNAATLTVQNAITATQVVAGYEWSLVRRPDGTVWAWGWQHRTNGTVQQSGIPAAEQALRPVQMYASVLTSVRAVAGWYDGWYALMEDGRVLHWGNARGASDGRGTDGNGTVTGSVPQFRYNATPVEMLEIVSGTPQPVNRVCSIAATQGTLLMIRSIDDSGATTSCNPGAAKTVWWVGTWTAFASDSSRVVVKIPGLPQSGTAGYSPPSVIVGGQSSSGDPPSVIGLEDGRAYGIGQNFYNGFGLPTPAPSRVGSAIAGPQLLPAGWGSLRGFGFSFYYSLFAIRTDGTVFASGYSNNAELGTGDVPAATYNGPLQVIAETCTATPCSSFLTGVDQIVSTDSLATLTLRSGQIYGWGRNVNGLLGLPSGTPAQVPYPRLVPASVAMTAISAANGHALAIGPGNAVYAWGSGLRGALGDGVDGNTRTTPQLVTLP